MNKKTFIREYSRAVSEGYAAIFTGAGTSVGSGFVNWKDLLKPFSEEMNLDIESETDLVRVAQYYQNYKGGRGQINQTIMNAFTDVVEENETIDLLTRLPITTYWTTNYDQLIEKGLEKNNKKVDVKITDKNLATNKYDRDAVVYKMHGDISLPHEAVLTKDDYELYGSTHALFTTALRGDLVSKTFLFVGFSFEDPNLDDILSKIKVLLVGDSRPHYNFQKKVIESDYDSEEKTKYMNDLVRQELRIEDLKRYGIQTILLDSFDEINDILKEIENNYLKNSIFISGSISAYENDSTEQNVNTFCYNFSKELVKENYKIISGFGLGIGSSIINGALDVIHNSKYKHLNEHLGLYPFPQEQIEGRDIKECWTKYRETIISECGICVFIYGNKLDRSENVINAEGMIEEFEIAKQQGKFIIPLANTGYASKEIYDQMLTEKDSYPYLEKYWTKLNEDLEVNNKKLLTEIIKDIKNNY